MLTDLYGRKITYLRISVTDRCNMRCVYCMPPEGIPWRPHPGIMRYEEIAEVVRVAAQEGVSEIRLTGGEPLVRLDLDALIRLLAEIPGIEDISLTTNALFLEEQVGRLKDAGLSRINISMDTLNPARYAKITRGASFERAWRGILAAEQVGLTPIKFNAVVMRGVNDDEILELARLAVEHPWQVRFIELMPIKNQNSWGEGFPEPENAYVSIAEMKERLSAMKLSPVNERIGSGPAQMYRPLNGAGTIGFISPLSELGFCGRCNRLRLTADGNLRPCLMSDKEISLMDAIRKGEPLLPILQEAVRQKPMGHELSLNNVPQGRCMTQIGG